MKLPGAQAAIVIVCREPGAREILNRELSKRYGADYQIVVCGRPAELEPWMRDLLAAGQPVALVIGAVGAQDPDGIEVLAAIRAIDPTALRVAAVRWGDWESVRSIFDAVALGKIDHWVTRPVQTPAEEFHRSITEFPREWGSQRGGGFEAVRVIGERWSARSAASRARSVAEAFAEEHPLKAVLLAPVGLGVPMPRVVGEVLGHGLVGVEPYLAEVKATGMVLGQGHQAGPDAASLSVRPDCHILQQQVARLGDEDDEANDFALLFGDPHLAAADGMRVVGSHRGRGLTDSRHVACVGSRYDRPKCGNVGFVSRADGDHSVERMPSSAHPLLPHCACVTQVVIRRSTA